MLEREMENRGSKSVIFSNIAVKEQRLDGNCCFISKQLRYTLMGFERNSQVKIPSNQIKTFSRISNCFDFNDSLKSNINKLNPWFITGFSDAESSFIVLIQPRDDSKTKWRVKAQFVIGLNKKDRAILEDIQYTLGVGRLYSSGEKVYYRVESFKELQVIIDHFDRYPLLTAKKVDYDLFKECFNIINRQEHLTQSGLLKLIKIKSTLNKGLSDKLKENFEKRVQVKRLEFNFKGISDPYWVAGFVSGDGSFNIKTTKLHSGRVQLRFAIHLHIRETEVIKGLANYLLDSKYNHHSVDQENEKLKYIYYTENSVAIQIVNFSDILNIIIPFFEKYPIQGMKRLDFVDFKIVADMVNNKEHLTSKGFDKILQIKEGMNLNRK